MMRSFSVPDMTHVSPGEIEKVKKLIEVLQMRQSLLSETTLVSEDALCPICYAQQKGSSVSFIQVSDFDLPVFPFQMQYLSLACINHVIPALFSTS